MLHGHPPQWLPSFLFHPALCFALVLQGGADRTRRSKGMAAAAAGPEKHASSILRSANNGSMRSGYTAASAGIPLQCLVGIASLCSCQRIASGGGEGGGTPPSFYRCRFFTNSYIFIPFEPLIRMTSSANSSPCTIGQASAAVWQ